MHHFRRVDFEKCLQFLLPLSYLTVRYLPISELHVLRNCLSLDISRGLNGKLILSPEIRAFLKMFSMLIITK